MPTPAASRPGSDRCPGALRLHAADDGYVARIRLAGGRLDATQLRGVCNLADELGDGVLHLTGRGNLQVRGLSGGCGSDVASRLQALGLLPSLAHDRVRNIVALPDPALDDTVADLDRRIVAEPRLTALSGRFLFGVGIADADVAIVDGRVLVGGVVTGRSDAVEVALDFLDVAGDAWRVSDLPPGVRARLAGPDRRSSRATERPSRLDHPGVEGWPRLGYAATDVWRDVAGLGDLIRFTPWRSVVIADAGPEAREPLQHWGFSTAPDDTWALVSACIGSPGCGRARADVRADATALAAQHSGVRLHVVGCERRCGHPSGPHLAAVATGDGYEVGQA